MDHLLDVEEPIKKTRVSRNGKPANQKLKCDLVDILKRPNKWQRFQQSSCSELLYQELSIIKKYIEANNIALEDLNEMIDVPIPVGKQQTYLPNLDLVLWSSLEFQRFYDCGKRDRKQLTKITRRSVDKRQKKKRAADRVIKEDRMTGFDIPEDYNHGYYREEDSGILDELGVSTPPIWDELGVSTPMSESDDDYVFSLDDFYPDPTDDPCY